MRLAGEVAVVTGSTTGIGAEIARRFAAEGARVLVTGRNVEDGEAVAAECNGSALFVAADLADGDTPDALVRVAVERFGSLSVLVNNAVANDADDGPVTRVGTQTWQRVLQVNLVAAAQLCGAAIPAMVAAGRGSIVN